MKRARLCALVFLLVLTTLVVPRGVTSQTPAQPLVILISLDGFRWDYLDRVEMPNLRALAARGVRSEGLIPSFPSVTFPNHYTIVTGLVPDHHGIVANTMVDPTIGPEKFTMSAATARDSRWWGGEPIWITAAKQGHKSAAMFWPGSEAVKPTFWKAFDDSYPNPERVAQVLEWMKLPEGQRPIFTTLYFSDIDHAGHEFGPLTPELLTAAARVDESIGQLVRGIDTLGLTSRTTFVVVSDHGMASTSNDRLIYLDDYLAADEIEVVDLSPNVAINPRNGIAAETIYRKLVHRHPALAVYRKSQLPKWLSYGAHSRVPEVIGIAEAGWTITTHALAETRFKAGRSYSGGAHGYDPRNRDLHGLFVAAGPRLRVGVIVPEFQNIHIYNLMCELLNITPAPNDGDFAQVERFLAR